MRTPKSNSKTSSQDYARELLLFRFVCSGIKLDIKLNIELNMELNIKLNIELNALLQLIKQFATDSYASWPIEEMERGREV